MLVYITMAVALVLTSKPTCDIHVLVKVPEDALAPRSNTDLDCSVGRRAEGAPSVNEFGDLVTDIVCRNWCETARSAYCYASDKPEMVWELERPNAVERKRVSCHVSGGQRASNMH